MPTDAKPMPRPTRSGLKVLAVGLLGLILLYVASVGPAYRVIPGASHPLVDAAYWPLFAVCRSCDPMSRILDWYFRFWCDGGVPIASHPGLEEETQETWGDNPLPNP